MPTTDPCRLGHAVRPGSDPLERSGTPRVPVRTCVGCRRRAEQSALLRVVAVPGEHATALWLVTPDERRRGQGRGAYVHPDPGCLSIAIARRAFGRALRLPAGATVDVSAVQEWFQQQ